MEEQLNDEQRFFILYKPKDIVSGDFYWALAHKTPSAPNELFYMCTADCTGHGVPGAFMSMLNISYLNETIIEKGIHEPNEVLNHIRAEIIGALNPEGSEEEAKDGMDCALCAFDFPNMKLHFAAANNPVWIVSKTNTDDQKTAYTLREYKADKMPVGKYSDHFESFKLQTVDLKSGDIVYTFTDGYADQFGGPKGKKFKYKQLEEILLSNAHLPLTEQKQILDKTMESWKSGYEQIDDILVIGVKV